MKTPYLRPTHPACSWRATSPLLRTAPHKPTPFVPIRRPKASAGAVYVHERKPFSSRAQTLFLVRTNLFYRDEKQLITVGGDSDQCFAPRKGGRRRQEQTRSRRSGGISVRNQTKRIPNFEYCNDKKKATTLQVLLRHINSYNGYTMARFWAEFQRCTDSNKRAVHLFSCY